MNKHIFTSQEAINNGFKLYQQRYAEADFAIASGSIVTGQGTYFSDLDLVVIFPKLECAYRESFMFNDMPIEAFVHDYETIEAFICDDYNNAHVAIINMIATGVVVPEENERYLKLKRYASSFITKGALPLKQEDFDQLRYNISDLLDDLKGNRQPEEYRAILYHLYYKISELALRRENQFFAPGKHMPKSLRKQHPKLATELNDIMLSAHEEGFNNSHIERLEKILTSLGGYLFDGFKQSAPKDKRKDPKWLHIETF